MYGSYPGAYGGSSYGSYDQRNNYGAAMQQAAAMQQQAAGYAGLPSMMMMQQAMAHQQYRAHQMAATNAMASQAPSRSLLVHEFVQRWSFSDEATAFLDSLSAPVQTEVVEGFNNDFVEAHPSRDVNQAFLAFARQTTAKVFIEQWGLSIQSWDYLRSLPDDVQVTIMASYAPTDPNSAERDATFQAFASAKSSEVSMMKAQVGSMDPTQAYQQQLMAAQQLAAGQVAMVDPRAMNTFQAKWKLSRDSIQALMEMDVQKQADIIASFCPHDVSRDLNAVFRSFLNSRRGPQFARAPSGWPAEASYPSSLAQGYGNEYESQQDIKGGGDRIEVFRQRWGLDQASLNFMRQIPPEVAEDIMASFMPKDLNRDCNGIFMSFARSRLSGQRIPDPTLAQGAGGRSIGGSKPMFFNPDKPEDEAQFIEMWALNQNSIAMLKEVPPHLKLMVMNEFKPHDVSRDVNSVFVSFLKSRGAAAGGGAPYHGPWTGGMGKGSNLWMGSYGYSTGKNGALPIGLPVSHEERADQAGKKREDETRSRSRSARRVKY